MANISRQSLCIVAALLCSALVVACARADDTERTIEQKELSFHITIPVTWKDRKVANKHICIMVRQEGPAGCVPSLFNVYVSDDKKLSDDELAGALRGSRKQTVKDFPNTDLSKPEDVTLDGVKAVRYTFTKTLNGRDAKTMYLLALRHGRLYQLAFDADATQFDAVLPVAQKIIDSFAWTD